MKQKKLFSLDEESVGQLEKLSKHYDMNKSETVRRLIGEVYNRECEESVELHFNLPRITAESIVRRALELRKTQAKYISDLVSADLSRITVDGGVPHGDRVRTHAWGDIER